MRVNFKLLRNLLKLVRSVNRVIQRLKLNEHGPVQDGNICNV